MSHFPSRASFPGKNPLPFQKLPKHHLCLKRHLRLSRAGWLPAEVLESRQLLSGSIWGLGSNLPAGRGDAGALLTNTGIDLFGGSIAGTASNSVIQLDPNNNFSATSLGSLSRARTGAGIGQSGFYAVVFGGVTTSTPLSSAEEFTVITNDGEGPVSVPSMSIPRVSFASATDDGGDIYAIGGVTSSNVTTSSAEMYNPTINTWSPIAPLPTALSGASAASDRAGHIFVFGGKTASGTPVSSVYRYTVATNTWDVRQSMPVAVSDATAVYAFYGSIYVAGGKSSSGAVNNFDLYNPVLDTWTAEPALPAPVYGAAGVVDYNSNFDLIGGFNSAGGAVTTVEYTSVSASTISLPQPPTLSLTSYGGTTAYTTYTGTPQAVSASAQDPYRDAIAGTFSYTYNGSTTPPTNAGTYNVVAQFTSQDPNYVNGAIAGTYVISPAYPAVTVSGGGTFTYNGQPHSITATEVGVDGVKPVTGTFSYNYSGSSTAPTTWGTYTAVATFNSTDPNYTDATSSPVSITIPDPRIPTGVTVTGASTTSVNVAWAPVTLPDGSTPLYDVIEEGYYLTTKTVSGGSGRDGGGAHTVTVVNYTFPLIATNVSGTSMTVTTATESAITGTFPYLHPSFEIESVDTAASPVFVSSASTLTTGDPTFAPYNPASVSNQATVEVGNSVNLTPLFYANPAPTYTLSAPPSVLAALSVNSSGGVTYSPVLGASGTVSATITATNSLGSVSQPLTFTVQQRPTVVVTGGTFSYDGNVHAATAVAYDVNGNVMAGTFTFQYQPVGVNVWSTASYVSPGTYNVQAFFTPSVAGYGTAIGTGTQTIISSSLQVLSFPGPTGYIGLDSTGSNLIVAGTINGQPGFNNQYAVSSFDTIQSTGSYLGTQLYIDLTNGNPIPTNGLTFTGGGVPNANSITIADNSGNPDTIVATDGQIIVNGRVISYSNVGSVMMQTMGLVSLYVAGGTFEIASSSGSGITAVNFSDLSIGAGASLVVMNSTAPATRTVVNTASLSIAGSSGAWTGTLDLGSNDLIVGNTAGTAGESLATLTDQLASGYAGGLWNGTGIQSSAAAADTTYLTALGLMRNGSAATFDGVAVDSNAILIKYTYYGDTNLDGAVSSADYTRIDGGFLTTAAGWNNGDLNYDNVINGSDYTLIDNAFNMQGASLAAQIAAPAAKSVAVSSTPASVFQSSRPIAISTASAYDSLTEKDVLDALASL